MGNLLEVKIKKDTVNNVVKAVKQDHVGQHAELVKGGKLKIERGTGWNTADGFTQIKFYTWDRATKTKSATPIATWSPSAAKTTTEIKLGNTKEFDVAAEYSGTVCDAITLTDARDFGNKTGEDDLYYEVVIGGLPMDPEIVNKSGTTGNSKWVTTTTA